MSGSPTYCRVLIPPLLRPEPEGGAARAPAQAAPRGGGTKPPDPGAETPQPPAEAEPLPAPPRTHPALLPSAFPATDQRRCPCTASLRDRQLQAGEGTRATPSRAGHQRLCSGSPAPKAGYASPNRAQGTSSSSPTRTEADGGLPTPLSTPTWTRSPRPHFPRPFERSKKSQTHPPPPPGKFKSFLPPRSPRNSALGPRRAPPQNLTPQCAPPRAGAQPHPGLPGGRRRAGPGLRPALGQAFSSLLGPRGPRPLPAAPPPPGVGEGQVPPPQRPAQRLREGEGERGRGRRGRPRERRGGGLTCATAMPAAAAKSLSWAEARRATREGVGARRDKGGDGSQPAAPRPCLVHLRETATGRSPGISRVGALPTPGSRTGERAPIRAGASMRKQGVGGGR